MKRTTISLPDQLQQALEQYRWDQGLPLPVSTLIQAAVREFLAQRGYAVSPPGREFHITPQPTGSGSCDTSSEHDRYFAEAVSDR